MDNAGGGNVGTAGSGVATGHGGNTGTAGTDLGTGPGGNFAMTTDAAVAVTTQEASIVSYCRGICPTDDSGVFSYLDGGTTCIPGSTVTCGSAATCNAGAVAICDKNGTLGACPPSTSSCTAVPDTWTPVALAPDQNSCPSGFGAGKPYFTSAAGDPLTCLCACGGSQACSGSATLNEYAADAGPSCAGAPATRTLPLTPTCQTGGFGNVLAGNAYTISDIAYAPGPTCSATSRVFVKPDIISKSITVCGATSPCASGACLAPTEAPNLCVEKDGTNTCPMGYPNRTLMSPAIDDGRVCGACACGSTLSCTLKGVILDNANTCMIGDLYEMAVADTCSDSSVATSNFPVNAVLGQTSSTGNGTCAETAPSMPTGTVKLQDLTTITVCCK